MLRSKWKDARENRQSSSLQVDACSIQQGWVGCLEGVGGILQVVGVEGCIINRQTKAHCHCCVVAAGCCSEHLAVGLGRVDFGVVDRAAYICHIILDTYRWPLANAL